MSNIKKNIKEFAIACNKSCMEINYYIISKNTLLKPIWNEIDGLLFVIHLKLTNQRL